MSVQIRPIRSEDEEAWKGLWEQYNEFYKRTIPADVTKTTFSRFLDDDFRMYCAVAVDQESDEVIGFATWYPHVNTATVEDQVYLNDLFVDPSIRNKGAGRKLIENVYDWAKANNAKSVYWLTQHFNHRAQLLYTKVADKSDFVHYMKDF